MRKVVLPLVVMAASTGALAQSFGDLMFLQNQGGTVANVGLAEGWGTREYDSGTLATGTYTKTYNEKQKKGQRTLSLGGSYGLSDMSRVGVSTNYSFKNALSHNEGKNSTTGNTAATAAGVENDKGLADFTFNYQQRFMKESMSGFNWDLLVGFTPGIGRAYTSGQSGQTNNKGDGITEAIEGNNRNGGHSFSVGTQASKVVSGLESVVYINFMRNLDSKVTQRTTPFEKNWRTDMAKAHNVWDIGAKFQYKLMENLGLNFGVNYSMTPEVDHEYGELNNGANRSGKDSYKVAKRKDMALNAGLRHICSSSMFMDLGYTYNKYDDMSQDHTAQGATTSTSRVNYTKWTNHTVALNANWLF